MLRMAWDKNCLSFYIEGREKPFHYAFDLEPLAERVLAGENVRVVAREAIDDIAKSYARDGSEKQWQKGAKVRRAISELGVDEHAAWTHYMQGQVEAAAIALEAEILEECEAILDDTFEVVVKTVPSLDD